MEDAGSRNKRKRTNLPALVQFTEQRWKIGRQLRLQRPQTSTTATPVKILKDNRNFVQLELMDRARNQYKIRDEKLPRWSFYAGIDSTNLYPVFIRTKTASLVTSDLENNHRGGMTKISRSLDRGPILPVPPCDMLRPGQITFLKIQTLDPEGIESHRTNIEPAAVQDIENYLGEQEKTFSLGCPCPVFIEDVQAAPDYAAFENTKPENWKLFRMMMPKIAGRAIPEALMDEIQSFLAKYPRDLVHPTFALSMCIVYHRYFYDRDYGREPAAVAASHRVPAPKLAPFLLYTPHYFRFHEHQSLAVYIHIFRFVDAMYKRDAKRGRPMAFTIKEDDIDREKVMCLIETMKLNDDDWIEIAPPSFHGSQLTMPANFGSRALRSEETTKSLMLPDVYTLGFPGYVNSGDATASLYRRVLVHKNWDWNKSNTAGGTLVHTNTRLRDDLDPYASDGVQLWTAPKSKARNPWTDHLVIDAIPRQLVRPSVSLDAHSRQQASIPAPLSQRYAASTIPLAVAEAYWKKHVQQIRAAREKGLIPSELHFGTRGLTWDGMPDNLAHEADLHPSINMDRLIAEDAKAQADILGSKDRRILKRLLKEDLAEGKHFAKCLAPLKQMINPNDEALKKSDIIRAMDGVCGPVKAAMRSMSDYGNGGNTAFSDQILKPCCLMLGLEYPPDIHQAYRLIHEHDSELGMAVGNITLRLAEPGSAAAADFNKLVSKVRYADSIMYGHRFRYFIRRLKGLIGKEDEVYWKSIFGRAYEE